MRTLLLSSTFLLSCLQVSSQFHYTITSSPDSAMVKVNGETICHTPCLIKYNWRDRVNGIMAFEVSAPGHSAWHDTVSVKPHQYNQIQRLKLDRQFPEFEIDTNSAIIAFDRLLADFNENTPIGRVVDKEGNTEELKWEGTVKIGERTFEQRFMKIIKDAGFRTPQREGAQLFTKNNKPRLQTPRYLVGAKLNNYDVILRHDDRNHYGAGPVAGRTMLELDWQVLDKATGRVVLSVVTQGISHYRQRSGWTNSSNLEAFEDALVKFLEQGEFLYLIQRTEGSFPMPVDSTGAPMTTISLARPNIPSFSNMSGMIKYADKACVTVVTEDGHGSGVIIDSDGMILSAYHVVDGSARMDVHFSDGLKQQAFIRSFDIENDVVLLEITGSGYRALPMGRSDSLSLGDEVITIGTPADLSLGQSVARGILSGKRILDENVYLQTDMAVSPGNSGGPLLNSKGEIVGIVQRKVVMSGVEGIGFAIPIERAAEKLHIQVE